MQPIDQPQRERALHPEKSFIVQAPAGSGKTELLIRRYLVLLANVNKAPEEILAITFTRKAAAEMRERIVFALHNALENTEPKDPNAAHTWHLARAALLRNQTANWNLLDNPSRLRIQTIDACCTSLTRQMPLLSGFGCEPSILEDAKRCYLQAARHLLNTLEENCPWSNALEKLLLHLDNNHGKAEKLFVTMLMQRDQWLPYIIHHDLTHLRKRLEQGLIHIIVDQLSKCQQLFPSAVIDELVALAQFAGNQVSADHSKSLIHHCQHLKELPDATPQHIPQWLAIVKLLLKNDGHWRNKVDVRDGFPPDAKSMKARMMVLVTQLREHELLRENLFNIIKLPSATYNENQWCIIEALIETLPILAAELSLVFRQSGVVDFSEVTLAALKALGSPEKPTDLALYLDHQIQHILVDEFQDTSMMQFRLLEQLTAGWQYHDGRTLFLVGDPMQSIYRFREAEVGLFLKAQQEGIGEIKLEPLTLQVNFRSQAPVVDWINTHFSKIFPENTDISLGAVPFKPSLVSKTENTQTSVFFHPFIHHHTDEQANSIADIISATQQQNPENTIAILVRSRNHLFSIIPVLKKNQIPFNAVEIETLSEQTVIQDLSALTRALLHPSDRIAWLAILRAPWCGLTLADLHALTNNSSKKSNKPLWEEILHFHEIKKLTDDGKKRLARFVSIVAPSITQRRRLNLRAWIEGAWLALGGPACLQNKNSLDHAQTFFSLLEELDHGSEIADLIQLEEKVSKLYAIHHDEAHSSVQIMTIHKAKGLEFDTVIIPCLERKIPSDDQQLLMWLDRPRAQTDNDLILAPIKAMHEEHDPIYHYLRMVEKDKSMYETARLLYVAATRAKQSLHWLATAHVRDESNHLFDKPDANSFLALFWPDFKMHFETKLAQNNFTVTKTILAEQKHRTLQRLSHDWKQPLLPAEYVPVFQTDEPTVTCTTDKTQTNKIQQIMGTIIHQCLQKITIDGLAHWTQQKISASQSVWEKILLRNGIPEKQIKNYLAMITKAVSQTLEDSRGRWILDEQHKDAHSEYALTTFLDKEIRHFIIDRTFIDNNNIRWIIDYKTANNHDQNDASFMENQIELHHPQLEQYAKLMQLMEKRPIKLGLYFPLCKGWHEWDFID